MKMKAPCANLRTTDVRTYWAKRDLSAVMIRFDYSPDEHEASVWDGGLDRVESAKEEWVVLLLRQAANVNHNRVARGDAPGESQVFIAARRIEKRCIDAARKEADFAVALRLEPRDEFAGRHEGAERAVVKTAQPSGDHRLQQSKPVVARVLVEVRVETRRDRYAHPVRRVHRRPAERSLGCDVNEVGLARAP